MSEGVSKRLLEIFAVLWMITDGSGEFLCAAEVINSNFQQTILDMNSLPERVQSYFNCRSIMYGEITSVYPDTCRGGAFSGELGEYLECASAYMFRLLILLPHGIHAAWRHPLEGQYPYIRPLYSINVSPKTGLQEVEIIRIVDGVYQWVSYATADFMKCGPLFLNFGDPFAHHDPCPEYLKLCFSEDRAGAIFVKSMDFDIAILPDPRDE